MNRLGFKTFVATSAVFLGLLLANSAMASQASSYTETNLVDGQCEQNAYNIAVGKGVTNIEVKNPIVTFTTGPYECAARCIIKHNIVFFYCVGPEFNFAHGIVEYMKENGQWLQ
jgi:hypothetical protein